MTAAPSGGVAVVQHSTGVRTVTMINPARRNAMDDGMRGALASELEAAMSDPACGAVVLTGVGSTFCSGGELASMPTTDVSAVRARVGAVQHIVRRIVMGPKPVVAAVEGIAYGSGFGLAAACDIVVVASGARFCASFRNVGLVPDAALAWSLPRRVGFGRARRIVLLAEPLTGAQATEIGLADELVEDGAALVRAEGLAVELASAAPLAIAGAKNLLVRAFDDLDPFLAAELATQAAMLASADFTEGRCAFFARRAAVFRGE